MMPLENHWVELANLVFSFVCLSSLLIGCKSKKASQMPLTPTNSKASTPAQSVGTTRTKIASAAPTPGPQAPAEPAKSEDLVKPPEPTQTDTATGTTPVEDKPPEIQKTIVCSVKKNKSRKDVVKENEEDEAV